MDVANELGITVDKYFLDQASFIFFTPDNTPLILLVILPSVFISIFFIFVTSIIACFSFYCYKKSQKKILWMTNIAKCISNMELENSTVNELEEYHKKKGKLGSLFYHFSS